MCNVHGPVRLFVAGSSPSNSKKKIHLNHDKNLKFKLHVSHLLYLKKNIMYNSYDEHMQYEKIYLSSSLRIIIFFWDINLKM